VNTTNYFDSFTGKKLSKTVCLIFGPYNFLNARGGTTNLEGTNRIGPNKKKYINKINKINRVIILLKTSI
jgi:hypothetical protein